MTEDERRHMTTIDHQEIDSVRAGIEVVKVISQQAKEIAQDMREELKNHIATEGDDVKQVVNMIHKLDLSTQRLADSVELLIKTVADHENRLDAVEQTKLMLRGGWLGITTLVSVMWIGGIAAIKYFFGS